MGEEYVPVNSSKGPPCASLDKLKPKPQMKGILKSVADYHKVSEADIVKRGGKRNQARDIAI